MVSAIVVNYRRPDVLVGCLRSLRESLLRADDDSELIVVDNASGDHSTEVIRETAPEASLIEMSENVGFPAAVNEAIRQSSGEWVLLINNDVEVEPGAVGHMLDAGRAEPEVGSVAAQMRFADGNSVINSAGIGVDRLGIAYDRLLGLPVQASETEPREVFGACGGAALHRRTMLEQVGGLDASFFFCPGRLRPRLASADARLALRLRAVRGRLPPSRRHRRDFWIELQVLPCRTKPGPHAGQERGCAHLRRYGLAMVAYDLAYVAFAAVTDHTLAPLRGRIQGLREWRAYRRRGAARRPVALDPALGPRAALRRRAAWVRHSAAFGR